MALPDIFNPEVAAGVVMRINQLTPETKPVWGTMSVDKMLAHCNVTYEMVYDNKHKKPGSIGRFVLKLLVKPTVTNEKPYRKKSQTAPAFIIKDERNFEQEKQRLVAYLQRVVQDGRKSFEGKESNSFGQLNADEWNNMFYKHLDHHLSQFGV